MYRSRRIDRQQPAENPLGVAAAARKRKTAGECRGSQAIAGAMAIFAAVKLLI
jgi:hypothetical protein